MINKVVRSLVQDLENIFSDHSIDIPARNTPDLADMRQWGRNFMVNDLSSPPAVPDKNMLNGLLYRVARISLNTERLANSKMQGYVGDRQEHLTSEWVTKRMPYLSPVVDHIHHARLEGTHDPDEESTRNSDISAGVIRNTSLLDVELEFLVISDSQDFIYDIHLIIYQILLFKNALTVEFKFNEDIEDTFEMPYQLLFDRDSVEIDYANFDVIQNTIQFNLTMTGAFMSNYFMKEYLIDLVDMQLEIEKTSRFY